MLFDIRSGKRRRVIQVVFSFLAVLFAVSFIGFGIGGDVSIDPSQWFGGGSDANVSEQYEQDIEDAEAALADDPKDERALIELATARYLTGRSGLTQDPETGQTSVPEDARAEIDQALDAWESYLDLDPRQPDVDTARQMVQAYTLINDAGGAAETQEVIAADQPTTQNLYALALYRYSDLDVKAGDQAADDALAEASESEGKNLERVLDQLRSQAERAKKQASNQGGSGGEEDIADPFGGLDGAGGGGGTLPGQ